MAGTEAETHSDQVREAYSLCLGVLAKVLLYRVVNVIRSWLTDYLYEDDDAVLLVEISEFAARLPAESAQQLARMLERRVGRLFLLCEV